MYLSLLGLVFEVHLASSSYCTTDACHRSDGHEKTSLVRSRHQTSRAEALVTDCRETIQDAGNGDLHPNDDRLDVDHTWS